MLKRDRRWCAGNLQHFWFLFARGIEMGSRLQIWIGLMGYLCSPLWLTFLVAGSFGAYFRMRFLSLSAAPEDLSAAASTGAGPLLALTLGLLFVPRLLGILTSLTRARQLGGAFRMLVSAFLENLMAFLMAPVLMMFHTLFVLLTISGWQIKWTTQNRADTGLSFAHCIKLYGWLTFLGLITCFVVWRFLDFGALWLTPIWAGWILAPFLAWITSSRQLGMRLRSWGLFVTPEEAQQPPELQGLDDEDDSETTSPLWTQALLIPYVQAVHLLLVRQGTSGGGSPVESLVTLRERLVRDGPEAVNAKEKLRLLWNSETVYWLHRELWSRPRNQMHPSWIKLQDECGGSRLLADYLTPSPSE